MPQAQRTVTFGSVVGLHARPASKIAEAVVGSGHAVFLEGVSGTKANAASVLMLLTMGTRQGDELLLTVDGDDADTVADALASYIASDLDAD